MDATKSPYINDIPYKWAHGESWFGKFFGGTLINCWRDLRSAFQKYFMVGNKIKTQLAPELEGNDMLNLAKGGMKFWALIISGFIYLIMSNTFSFYLRICSFNTDHKRNVWCCWR